MKYSLLIELGGIAFVWHIQGLGFNPQNYNERDDRERQRKRKRK